MSDVISRAEALKAMHKMWRHIVAVARRNHPTKGELAVYLDMQAAINAMPSAQQWIPCDEKLPPENHEVLVSIYNENSEPWYAVTKREGDFWETLGHTKNIVGEMAWMELPKAYEVEK